MKKWVEIFLRGKVSYRYNADYDTLHLHGERDDLGCFSIEIPNFNARYFHQTGRYATVDHDRNEKEFSRGVWEVVTREGGLPRAKYNKKKN